MAIMDSDLAAPDLWSKERELVRKTTGNINQLSTLSFHFDDIDQSSKQVQLPLANTVFINGRLATLLAQRWINGTSKESRVHLACIQEVELESQTLRMTRSINSDSVKSSAEITTRLKPITNPRVVSAVTGNIIRQVVVDGNVSRPASEELEKVVNDRLQTVQLERVKLEVWALIKPRDVSFGKGCSDHDFDLSVDIARGARLCKVLSGGGGWGEKQGLLALDPDGEYSGEDSHIDQEKDIKVIDETAIFADIANKGDTITFLTSDEFGGGQWKANMNHLDSPSGPWRLNLQEKLVEFGCLPSKVDRIPTAKSNISDSGSAPLSVLIKKYFGMLSEVGMSLKVSIHTSPKVDT